ncbi:MAG: 4-hydroxybenzoyl-CoA reductase subunit alpha, partial [Alphaproteobacteria bacterium]|nr:4-hydroxybenzoyl-CoA reductase subunit alpha [Alphaproteobacteria bacterium]
MSRIGRIGAPLPLVDGPEKVSGKALFTADMAPADALVGKILRCPWSHARLLGVDVEKARALPGVAAVITGEACDVPFGVLPI